MIGDRHRPRTFQGATRRAGPPGGGVVGLADDHGQRGGVEPPSRCSSAARSDCSKRLHLASQDGGRARGAPAGLADGFGRRRM